MFVVQYLLVNVFRNKPDRNAASCPIRYSSNPCIQNKAEVFHVDINIPCTVRKLRRNRTP
jgi:hypothetical protein